MGGLVGAGKARGLEGRWRRLLEVAARQMPALDVELQRKVAYRLNMLLEDDGASADLARQAIAECGWARGAARAEIHRLTRKAHYRVNLVTDDSDAAQVIREWARGRV